MASRTGGRNSANQSLVKKKGLGDKKIQDDEFMAAAIGDTEWLKQSLRSKKGEVTYDKNGLAPIHLAAIHGRLDCLQHLIEKVKVDVNFPSNTGWRPIHLCISNQTGKRAFQCLMYLLEKDADPSIRNDDKITPAHQAASEGHVQCLKALIEVGATIDSADVRGHLPIDMAKLWGHRKCARILAAENWHQSKHFLAKEMKQLEKIQMQRALSDLSNSGQEKAAQEFYGDKAFQGWLQDRGLSRSSTGPKPRKDSPKLRPVSKSDTTMKPNSYRPQEAPAPKADEEKQTPPRKVQVASKEHTRQETPLSFTSSDGLYEKPHETPSPEQKSPSPPPKTGFYQEEIWNTSTKIPEKDYVTNLTDFYPRDEFSMQPRPPPKRERSPATLKRMGVEEKPVRMPKLPADMIKRKLDPAKYERPFVYKCKHIDDVHKRHVPDFETLPRNEAALHIMNDPKSILFRNGLLIHPTPGTASTTISGVSSETSVNKRSSERVNTDSVIRLVDRIAKNHDHYPNIKGQEYDLNLGQVAAI